MRNYQAPNCTVIEINHSEDIVTASVTGQTDAVDTYVSWDGLFGVGGE